MSKALIVRGYCGTGKSSVAKHIAKKNDFAFLEYDNFLWNMNTTREPSKFEYEITFKNFLSVLKNYLKTKKNILIEGPLVPRTNEDPFDIKKVISLIKKSNYECKIVQLTANEDICVKRRLCCTNSTTESLYPHENTALGRCFRYIGCI